MNEHACYDGCHCHHDGKDDVGKAIEGKDDDGGCAQLTIHHDRLQNVMGVVDVMVLNVGVESEATFDYHTMNDGIHCLPLHVDDDYADYDVLGAHDALVMTMVEKDVAGGVGDDRDDCGDDDDDDKDEMLRYILCLVTKCIFVIFVFEFAVLNSDK